MKRLYSVLYLVVFCTIIAHAQETFPVNGVSDNKHIVYAFTGAKIFTSYNMPVDNATLIVKDGRVVQAGEGIVIPAEAVVRKLDGKFIYPSFIDLYSTYGLPKIVDPKELRIPQIESKTKGAYNWNQAIKSEKVAAEIFKMDEEQAKQLRECGFGAVLSYYNDGITRGTSVFVTLNNTTEQEVILKGEAAANYSFYKGTSQQDYPSSLMGAIALLRQTYLDAEWYRKSKNKNETNLTLEAFNRVQNLPQIFEVDDKYTVLRADKVGDEFGVQYIFKAGIDGYQRIEDMKSSGAAFILPLTFPQVSNINNPYDALQVSLASMKHWELAPTNPGVFEKNGLTFAISATDLDEDDDFWANIRVAIANGLSESQALKSLTYTPAKLLKQERVIGSIKKGMIANFIITSGNIFDEERVIYENWIQGRQHVIKDMNALDISGKYNLIVEGAKHNLLIEGDQESAEGKIVVNDSVNIKVSIGVEGRLVTLSFKQKIKSDGIIRLAGEINGPVIKGNGQLPDGKWVVWTAARTADIEEVEEEEETDTPKEIGELYYPNMAYGWTAKPKAETVHIKNATVWTNEKEGILKETDVIIQNGKIRSIGKGLTAPGGAKLIDGKGLHLTAGIVDEHSHIAVDGGVNESGQSVSAEVSISDVINGDNINVYRQLAGGVTSAQLLHGSANAIGGQSGIIKFRWGSTPEEMKIKGADGFIKFALGENVKQSNWGDSKTVRYPQSRMGVEQVFYNAFIRAKEYEAAWKKFNSLSSKQKASAKRPRKDLELETLVEILNSKRFVTCHSYSQSEINMLMHVADSMGFAINTFTHILEGYKVADKMKAHGVGASTFSDWWAYKFEVNDAIPYNAAILLEQGVITAYNSDDSEMARRLNQEAAKAVKYGGVSEEEALKVVTLNPAKLLHLDNRLGSIKVGKDADVVLWTDNPLSVYAKVVKTFVDGICYYDVKEDEKMRKAIAKERARLIQKIIEADEGGEGGNGGSEDEQKEYNCKSLGL
ncbi:MAG TPA: amidohydrolase [Flavobacteriales bacterium]|nr:amidohydrolase [Flavobacteriales bacterium]